VGKAAQEMAAIAAQLTELMAQFKIERGDPSEQTSARSVGIPSGRSILREKQKASEHSEKLCALPTIERFRDGTLPVNYSALIFPEIIPK